MDKPSQIDSVLQIGFAIEKSEKSYVSFHKAGQRINITGNDNIFYLKKGNATIHTKNGNFVVFNYFGPEVVGVEKINGVPILNHLRCVSDIEIHVVKSVDFIELLNTHGLWRHVFNIASQYMNDYNARDFMIHQPTAKDTVIQYLKYIWTFSSKKRESTSVISFISARTYVARSSIHKFISELERDGLIYVKRGRLIDCKLPAFVVNTVKH